MDKMKSLLFFLPLVRCEVLWNGFFDENFTVAHFDKWSWSNQIPPYQWYIHGSQPTSHYLGLSADFKNPAATSDAQGIRITIDDTSSWNGQTMMRSEIIPQTTANLGKGHLFYHFSLSTRETNAPSPGFEHQIAFFESHFTELKYGRLSGATEDDNTLRWMVGGQTHWSTPLAAGTWYNFAYDIDFDAGTVGLWVSEGAAPLARAVENVPAATSTNSQDWHVGELRLDNGGASGPAEDWFWSGVYVESGEVTTGVAGPV
ncbi:glycoside hydrolase family 131 protein [Aspergillus clavatus NRRL 1]|uniref:Glycoside hydrolase 131 catalytic N-terminal domain-containing protein n=1 Tax=Aspergillus clavatus (strain ATCC 1007 / CBS 513.65 / DSM 816 / NCTC 3887 / NRRL 1 / QM 1276 / 107) TaxID=344612 RepID=A1C7N0_ASPCL|nr:uncharacterized protein ACLA_074380 [Aspergillus clavatus NRRL 1]EAW14401.1 conserved hypothetical protein [Aspergillus clavatus NRRL 1]